MVLTVVVLAVYPAVAAFTTAQHGVSTWLAAGVAAGVCWLGATLALVLLGCLRGPQAAIQAVLLGMLFRMGLPLVAGVVLSQRSAALQEAGFFGLVLAFYFVTLAAETPLAVSLIHNNPAGSKVS
jgi:hypothetical protein